MNVAAHRPGYLVEEDRGDITAVSGALLRFARKTRELTQRELADRAGVPQTTVARIESGRHQPSLPTLARLLAAAGFRPSLRLENTTRPSALLEDHRAQILSLASDHKISRVRVFGSVARGNDTPESDLDLLLDFEPGASLFDQAAFVAEVEQLLGVQVDAVSTRALRPPRQQSILRDARDL